MLLTILVFLLILTVLVLIHESGHYFVAKKYGIKVEEFGFGLPPRIWGKKVGETIYSINWLPIGGFVKLYGEDEAGGGKIALPEKEKEHTMHDPDIHRAFYSRPALQRALVIVAGVIMNTLLAIAIYYVFIIVSGFHTELPLIGNPTFFGVDQTKITQVIVAAIEKNSPAQRAGIQADSNVISIANVKINNITTLEQVVQANAGKSIPVTLQNTDTERTYTVMVTPSGNPAKIGIEIYPVDTVVLSYDTFLQRLTSGIIQPANLAVYNVEVLSDLVGISIKEKNVAPVSQGISGPVGIYSVVGTIIAIPNAKERFLEILNLAGLLSISLAFFNVLPIPGLDGGRLFFIVIEWITGKKVNPRTEGYAHAVGMVFLILLILLVTLNRMSIFPFLTIVTKDGPIDMDTYL